MEDTLSLKQLWDLLKKNKWQIFISTCICTLLMTGYLYFLAIPVYKSETEILINQAVPENSLVESKDVQANLQLVNTYASIITSPRILSEVSKKMDGEYSEKELEKMITVNSTAESQVIQINVEGEDAKDNVKIANATVKIVNKEIPEIMNIDNTYILSPAVYDSDAPPIKPHKSLLIAISAAVGMIIGVIIMFIRNLFDRSIKSTEDVEEILGISVLTVITEMKDEDLRGRNNTRRKRNRKG